MLRDQERNRLRVHEGCVKGVTASRVQTSPFLTISVFCTYTRHPSRRSCWPSTRRGLRSLVQAEKPADRCLRPRAPSLSPFPPPRSQLTGNAHPLSQRRTGRCRPSPPAQPSQVRNQKGASPPPSGLRELRDAWSWGHLVSARLRGETNKSFVELLPVRGQFLPRSGMFSASL